MNDFDTLTLKFSKVVVQAGGAPAPPGHAGIGAIGRGNDGEVVFLLSSYKGQHSNNLMEALAIKVAKIGRAHV